VVQEADLPVRWVFAAVATLAAVMHSVPPDSVEWMSAGPAPPDTPLPGAVLALTGGGVVHPVCQNTGGGVVFEVSAGQRRRFVKWAPGRSAD
jgi:hypothetical protein